MMKQMLLIGLLVILTSSQTTVTPKTQGCVCTQLMSQADCLAKACVWTLTNATNTSSTAGSCANSTTTTVVITTPPTFCLNTTNITLCASTVGCAFLNNTCNIFTGCSAYVQTTNAACQAISTQCTTDGTRCVPPTACSTYTTQALCAGNVATSGAKVCTWTASGTTGTCTDKVCTDAPATLTTNTLCTNWIAGCLTTGKGCASVLTACSSYTQAAGCTGMIGSDGPCTANTAAGSTVCRPLICTDAPTTTATTAACITFLTGCVTTGKGCVSSLSACSTYTQSQGCTGLTGSDGVCTTNTAAGSTACRTLACSDAPASTTTTAACVQFLAGCVTTGQGCTNVLGACSSYTGTTTTCSSYIGTDFNCKGTGTTAAACSARLCTDASTTTNTNAACAAFQNGCVTTGAGCTASLGACSGYQGTATTCLQYIGSDGNCTAPSSQVAAAACVAKVCTDAPASNTTNQACQSFSFNCVTTGAGCILPTTCEASALVISCQGNSACSSNQICLDRRVCSSYLTQSQCLLNQQQYVSGTATFLRSCTWASGTCSAQVCTALTGTLTSDALCDTALKGCLTKGTTCVDVSAACSAYAGLTAACQGFKGTNGTKNCTQLTAVTDATTACVERTCATAKTANTAAQTSAATCSSFLTGCNFDGKDNCTNLDCTTYFGTQATCGAITTALSGSTAQTCWKTANTADATTACIVKACSQATGTSYVSNAQCAAFLTGCVWNGQAAGGCVPNTTACTSYTGVLNSCTSFIDTLKSCTKSALFCSVVDCTTKVIPLTNTTTVQKGTYCQGFKDFVGNCQQSGAGLNCQVAAAASCASFVAIGADTNAKIAYCYALAITGAPNCSYISGDMCVASTCSSFTATQATDALKLAYCNAMSSDGVAMCGFVGGASVCADKSCADFGLSTQALCTAVSGCFFNYVTNTCFAKAACNTFTIPASQTTEATKQSYCARQQSTTSYCTFSVAAPTVCGAATVCTDNAFATVATSTTTDQLKALFCGVATKDDAVVCGYIATTPLTCIAGGICSTYSAYDSVAPTDLIGQQTCQSMKDTSGNVCNFVSGVNLCTIPQATCAAYKTYGADATANKALCQKLYTTDALKIQCDYGTTGTSCQNFSCASLTTGQSITTCAAYGTTCTFNGSACIEKVVACASYVFTTQAICSGLVLSGGGFCGFTAAGANCVARVCEQVTTGASAAICEAYLTTCQYNGAGCVTKAVACTSYTPTGATDAIKAAVCNAMNNTTPAKCTFIAGGTTCVATAACDYSITAPATNTAALSLAACSLAQDTAGAKCGWATGATCAPRACPQALTASTDTDCVTHMVGCEQNAASACASIACSAAPITTVTTAACGVFRNGCITNGAGCVEPSAACGLYFGTKLTCQGFVSTTGTIPCTNTDAAIATTACIPRTCVLNTTAKSDADCATWFPKIGSNTQCVWNGTSGGGCVAPQLCASFTGTIDSCPTFTATDGPCSGASATAAACSANSSSCTSAPNTFNTDALCKGWGPLCQTNGFGCVLASAATCTSILSPLVCPLYKSTLGCDLATQCKSKPASCGLLLSASECNNTPLAGSTTLSCAWNAVSSTCVALTCALLPVTLTSDSACSTQISTCTSNGAGCVTKAACTTYNKMACGVAVPTDAQKSCIWSSSVCRAIQCSDNTTATSDAACNTYLTGCRTTGTGCQASLTCSNFTNANLCLFDSTGYPCLWYKSSSTAAGTCISYAKCTDIISSSHAACQAASPLCTTNGTSCIAITGCTKTVLQASCILGTDGTCGWLPAVNATVAACAIYTNCAAATGTTTSQCQAWGTTCVSNGTVCITKSACSGYTTTTACANAGTDGTCFWVVPTGTATTGTCRLQLCSDSTTNMTTHAGCLAFSAQTACTSSGTACIPQSSCSSYSVTTSCVTGTDGVCFWATTTTAATATTAASSSSVCRLKTCTDSLLTSSSSCSSAITGVKCVSNGVNCIPQSTCSSYTAREACTGGGSDGSCAFTPGTNTTTPNVGTCALFTQCTGANSDQNACNSRSDACYFNSTTTNGTTTSSCSSHTCATKALGSSCQAVPSWDLSTYQICVLTGTTCAAGNPSSFTSSQCYANSVATYTWNPTTSTCGACSAVTVTPNTTTNSTNNTNGYIISLLIAVAFMF